MLEWTSVESSQSQESRAAHMANAKSKNSANSKKNEFNKFFIIHGSHWRGRLPDHPATHGQTNGEKCFDNCKIDEFWTISEVKRAVSCSRLLAFHFLFHFSFITFFLLGDDVLVDIFRTSIVSSSATRCVWNGSLIAFIIFFVVTSDDSIRRLKG